MDNNFASNLFQGVVKPVRRKSQATPVFDRYLVIGQSGDLFTKARCWVYEPTIEYPEFSIFLQLKNGSGSAFTKLNLADISEFSQAMSSWVEELQAILPALQQKQAQVNAYLDQYEAYTKIAEQIRNESSDDNVVEEKEQSTKKRR